MGRTPTTITIRPAKLLAPAKDGAEGAEIVPAFYEVYCRATNLGSIAVSDVEFVGTGIRYPHHELAGLPMAAMPREYTVTGLRPNERYILALLPLDAHGRPLSSGIGEPSQSVVTCLPDPLLPSWGYLVHAAAATGCSVIASDATSTLLQFFVPVFAPLEVLAQPCTLTHTGVHQDKGYELNQDGLQRVPTSTVRTFVQCLLAEADRCSTGPEAQVYSEKGGRRDVRRCQLERLVAVRYVLIAIEVCLVLEEQVLCLFAITKCFQLLRPFLEHRAASAYAIHALLTCHGLLRQLYGTMQAEFASGLDEVFAPITYHLLEHFMGCRAYTQVMLLVDQCTQVQDGCQVARPGLTDSGVLEQEWLGNGRKLKKGAISHFKTSYSAENYFHAKLATSRSVSAGLDALTSLRRPLLSRVSEFLEATLNNHRPKFTASLPAYLELLRGLTGAKPSTSSSTSPATPSFACMMLNNPKKSFEGSFTLGHFYFLAHLQPTDMLFTEMAKYRKDPRYTEFVARLVEHAFRHGRFAPAIKVALEMEEWVGKRNQCILLYDNIVEERAEAGSAESNIKHKVRPMFITRDVDKAVRVARQLASKHSPKRRQGQLLREELRTKLSRVVDLSALLQKAMRVPAANKQTKPASPVPVTGDAGASPELEGTGEPEHLGARRPSSSPSLSSRSESHVAVGDSVAYLSVREVGATGDAGMADDRGDGIMITAKRKRQAFRQAFFGALPSDLRDVYERCIKVLDHRLGVVWRQMRLRRRLRAVQRVEGEWMASLCRNHGLALVAQMELNALRAGMARSGEQSSFPVDGLQESGGLAYLRASLQRAEARGEALAPSLDPKQLQEAYQMLVRSVVLSGRAGRWLQVLEGLTHLWNVTRFLLAGSLLSPVDGWRDILWKAFAIPADYLLEMLEAVEILDVEEIVEDEGERGLVGRPATASEHWTPFTPGEAGGPAPTLQLSTSSRARSSKRASAGRKFSSQELTPRRAWSMRWTDRDGCVQRRPLPLAFCAQYARLTLDTLHVGGKVHRLQQLHGQFARWFVDMPLPGTPELPVDAATTSTEGLRQASLQAYAVYQALRAAPDAQASVVQAATFQAQDQLMRLVERAGTEQSVPTLVGAALKLAELLLDAGDVRGARKQWTGALGALVSRAQPLEQLWSLLAIDAGAATMANAPSTLIPGQGLARALHGSQNVLLVAILISCLARHAPSSTGTEGARELVRLAVLLLGALGHGSVGSLRTYSDYLHVPAHRTRLPATSLPEPWVLGVGVVLEHTLAITSAYLEAGDEGTVHRTLPVLALARHLNAEFCRCPQASVELALLSSRVYLALGHVSQSLGAIQSLLNGQGLVGAIIPVFTAQTIPTSRQALREERERELESQRTLDPLLPLSHDQNVMALKAFQAQRFGEGLAALYGPDVVGRIELARCALLLQLLQESPETHAKCLDFAQLLRLSDPVEMLACYKAGEKVEEDGEGGGGATSGAAPTFAAGREQLAATTSSQSAQSFQEEARGLLSRVEDVLWSMVSEWQPKADALWARGRDEGVATTSDIKLGKSGPTAPAPGQAVADVEVNFRNLFQLYSQVLLLSRIRGQHAECVRWASSIQGLVQRLVQVGWQAKGGFLRALGGAPYWQEQVVIILDGLYAKGQFAELLALLQGAVDSGGVVALRATRPWLLESYQLRCLLHLDRVSEASAQAHRVVALLQTLKEEPQASMAGPAKSASAPSAAMAYATDLVKLYEALGHVSWAEQQLTVALHHLRTASELLSSMFALRCPITTTTTAYAQGRAALVHLLYQQCLLAQRQGQVVVAAQLMDEVLTHAKVSVLLHPSLLAAICLTHGELQCASSSSVPTSTGPQEAAERSFLYAILFYARQGGYHVREILHALRQCILAHLVVGSNAHAATAGEALADLSRDARLVRMIMLSAHASKAAELYSKPQALPMRACGATTGADRALIRLVMEGMQGPRAGCGASSVNPVAALAQALAPARIAYPHRSVFKELPANCQSLLNTAKEGEEPVLAPSASQAPSPLVIQHFNAQRGERLDPASADLLPAYLSNTSAYARSSSMQARELHLLLTATYGVVYTNAFCVEGGVADLLVPPNPPTGTTEECGFLLWLPAQPNVLGCPTAGQALGTLDRVQRLVQRAEVGSAQRELQTALREHGQEALHYGILYHRPPSQLPGTKSRATSGNAGKSLQGSGGKRPASRTVPQPLTLLLCLDAATVHLLRELLILVHIHLTKSEWSNQPALRREAEGLWALVFHTLAIYLGHPDAEADGVPLPDIPSMTIDHAESMKRLLDDPSLGSLPSWGALRTMTAEETILLIPESGRHGAPTKPVSATRVGEDVAVRSILDWMSCVVPAEGEGGEDVTSPAPASAPAGEASEAGA